MEKRQVIGVAGENIFLDCLFRKTVIKSASHSSLHFLYLGMGRFTARNCDCKTHLTFISVYSVTSVISCRGPCAGTRHLFVTVEYLNPLFFQAAIWVLGWPPPTLELYHRRASVRRCCPAMPPTRLPFTPSDPRHPHRSNRPFRKSTRPANGSSGRWTTWGLRWATSRSSRCTPRCPRSSSRGFLSHPLHGGPTGR